MARLHEKQARKIVAGMEPWWNDVNKKRKPDKRDGRTVEERVWDNGVFAAAEMIRRMTGDEHLSAAMHELCFWARKLRERGLDLDGKPVKD